MKTNSQLPVLKRNSNFPALRGSFLQNWDDLWDELDGFWRDTWFMPTLSRRAFSFMDVNEDKYELEIELPGVQETEIVVERDGDCLRIKAEQAQKENKSYFSFEKSMTIPEDSDVEKIEPTLKDGVLKIVIPRKKEIEKKVTEPIKIQIKS